MALFKVPGWTVPTAPVSAPQKRKRPKQGHEHDQDEAELLRSAAANMEKLMAALGDGPDTPRTASEGAQMAKRQKKTHDKHARAPATIETTTDKLGKGKKVVQQSKPPARSLSPTPPASSISAPPKRNQKRDQKRDGNDDPAVSRPPQEKPLTATGMTAMQSKMKQSLDGARFRWINEEMYKSDSAHAHQMMRDDPKVFEEYHTGFRRQVQSWPTNPVSHYISQLSAYPLRTVIADLGCGDAALARALLPKGMVVLSFDLVADGAYVIEADTCGKLPLPGSEGTQDEATAGEGHVVDVVVCALSLMSTNWPATVREIWRVLKHDGELKIAEVASRFTDVKKFVSLVCRFGFKLHSKDASNTHFTLFEFRKQARKLPTPKAFEKLLAQGDVLKPCEYKRR